jgi:hypothetical protein
VTPDRYARLSERLFPYRGWFFGGSVVAFAVMTIPLAGVGSVRMLASLASILFALWLSFCICVWFHPTRGALRASAIPWRWLPGWVLVWARWQASCFVGLAVVVVVLFAGKAAWGAECSSHFVQQALSGDDLTRVNRVADLPPILLEKLWAAYGKADPDHRIADPGQPYQEGDVVHTPRLPRRRLVTAARSARIAYLYYEKGGRGHSFHMFVACLDAPDSPAFSYVKPISRDWYPSSSVERCLVSPPREHLVRKDRGRCLPLPEVPGLRVRTNLPRCGAFESPNDPEWILSLDELPRRIREAVERHIEERMGRELRPDLHFRFGDVAPMRTFAYSLVFVLDVPGMQPLPTCLELDASGGVVHPLRFPDIVSHPERRPRVLLDDARGVARTFGVPESADFGLTYNADRDSLEWIFETTVYDDAFAQRVRVLHIPAQESAAFYWGEASYVK